MKTIKKISRIDAEDLAFNRVIKNLEFEIRRNIKNTSNEVLENLIKETYNQYIIFDRPDLSEYSLLNDLIENCFNDTKIWKGGLVSKEKMLKILKGE